MQKYTFIKVLYMKYYLVSIIIILLGLLFLNTFFDKILRERESVPRRVIMGADGLRSGRGAPRRVIMGADGGVPRIENFATDAITGESICSLYSSKPAELNSKCGSLTETNCNATSCCVWLNGETCVAGNAQGPTFLTKNGKTIDVKTYSTGAS